MLPLIVLFIFLTVFLACFALFLGFTAAKESPTGELKRRLRRMAMTGADKVALPDDLRAEILREMPPFDRFISRFPGVRNLDKQLDQAGLKITPARFLAQVAAAAVILSLLSFLWKRNWVFSLIILLLVVVLPFVYIAILKTKRAEKFTEQLPDALTMIGRSLRAGHSLNSAIELVGLEMAEPLSGLFKIAFEQQKLGLRITETLANMTTRIESIDLRFFVVVVSVNSDIGGNLAEILDKLAETIRERIKLRRQVQVYTAQGRLSGYLLAVLPIVVFVILHFVMIPGYENVLLENRSGHFILAGALLSQFIGFLFIRKIINIRI